MRRPETGVLRFFVPRSRAGMLWRALLAAVIVIPSCAAAVATAGLLQVNTLVHIISVNPGITSKQIKLAPPGAPETILLIGSDHRYGEPFKDSNTDTMLLMRLNSKSSTINVMSIPRDLKVSIPGYGYEKLNAAYSIGGYSLLIKTIRQQVFPGFYPNHIIDTNFGGFSDLVDAIGCVYSDVDHRYYNISSGPLGSATNFSSIDIQPGYQKLCGDNQSISGALPFVRFRHTDTDIVRNARQQDFLRWAKLGYPLSKLVANRYKLISILSKHSTTDKDLHSEDALLDLFNLVAFSDGDALNQVSFPAILPSPTAAGPSYVTAEPAAEQAAYRQFLRATPRASAKKATPSNSGGSALAGSKAHHTVRKRGGIDTAGLIADPSDGASQGKLLTHPGMPVYYPRLIPSSAQYCFSETANCDDPVEPQTAYDNAYPRQYLIPTSAGHKANAYFMTIVVNSDLGEYVGVQGVQWTDPPLFNASHIEQTVNGRKLFVYDDDSGHVTDVAWHQGINTYWISNTLQSAIPNHEMVAMAASMVRYRG